MTSPDSQMIPPNPQNDISRATWLSQSETPIICPGEAKTIKSVVGILEIFGVVRVFYISVDFWVS